MKMFKKVIAITAALAAASSLSAVALADDFTATYDAEADTVSVTDLTATFSDQITVVIVPDGAESITSDNIYYINQSDSTDMLTDMGVIAGSIVEGTYEVRIGCSEGQIYTAKFTVGGETPEYPLGDANLSGDVTAADAAVVLSRAASGIALSPTAELCADANKSGDITAADGAVILTAAASGTVIPW